MSDEGKNGAVPPGMEELTPEQQAEVQQMLEYQRMQTVQRTVEIGLLTLDDAQRAKVQPEAAVAMAAGVVDALPQLAQAIEDVANPKSVGEIPYWGFKLIDRSGKVLGATVVPKKITGAKSPDEVIQYLATLSFILSPVPHFVANLLGLRLEVVQTRTPPPGHSKIIV